MIKNIIEFSDLVAKDILTPRINVTTISVDLSVDEIENIFIDTGYSRLPVYDGEVDNIIGTLYQKDFFSKVKRDKASIREAIKEAKFIVGSKNIKELLSELQSSQTHIAIVIGEFGNMIGIVTMEDILEEIVGEIWDEEDEIEHDFNKVSDNEYIVHGIASVSVLEDIPGFEIDTDVTTVNGWIIENTTSMPKVGESFEYKGYNIEILSINHRRAGKVSIKRIDTDL